MAGPVVGGVWDHLISSTLISGASNLIASPFRSQSERDMASEKRKKRQEETKAEFHSDIASSRIDKRMKKALSKDASWYSLPEYDDDDAWDKNRHLIGELWRKFFCRNDMKKHTSCPS